MCETSCIRKATAKDLCRIAEIEIFNYRMNFYPIFRNDAFYFGELQVTSRMEEYRNVSLEQVYVYDDGVVKGFIFFDDCEIRKLFVEPAVQGCGIGASLLKAAMQDGRPRGLWALEKNARAIAFYERHGFTRTGERMREEDTAEYLIRMRAEKR